MQDIIITWVNSAHGKDINIIMDWNGTLYKEMNSDLILLLLLLPGTKLRGYL